MEYLKTQLPLGCEMKKIFESIIRLVFLGFSWTTGWLLPIIQLTQAIIAQIRLISIEKVSDIHF